MDRSVMKSIFVPDSEMKDVKKENWGLNIAHEKIVLARTSP